MREAILRPEAERDIADIADYTIEQWGKKQARLYVLDLRQAIEGLSSSAVRHPLAEDALPGLRRIRCRHHLIFYLINETTVDVVRVLHERMDTGNHLDWLEIGKPQ